MKYIKTKNVNNVIYAIISQIVAYDGNMAYYVLGNKKKIKLDFKDLNQKESEKLVMHERENIINLLNKGEKIIILFDDCYEWKIKKVQDYYYINEAEEVVNCVAMKMLDYAKDFKFDIFCNGINIFHKYYIFNEKSPQSSDLPSYYIYEDNEKYYEKCEDICKRVIKEIKEIKENKDCHQNFVLKNDKIKFVFSIL